MKIKKFYNLPIYSKIYNEKNNLKFFIFVLFYKRSNLCFKYRQLLSNDAKKEGSTALQVRKWKSSSFSKNGKKKKTSFSKNKFQHINWYKILE